MLLPGLTGGIIGASSLLNLSEVSALRTESSGATCQIHASALSGDLCVFHQFSGDAVSGAPSDMTPSGFTNAVSFTQTNGSAGGRVILSYKVLTGSDPGANVTGMNDSTDYKQMSIFRGTRPIISASHSVFTSAPSTGDNAAQNALATAGRNPLVVLGGIATGSGDGTAAFSTVSPAFDGSVLHTDNHLLIGWKIENDTLADVSVDMADLGTFNLLWAGYIQCS